MSRNPCDFSPGTWRSLWWQLSFLFPLGSDVSLYDSSHAIIPHTLHFLRVTSAITKPPGLRKNQWQHVSPKRQNAPTELQCQKGPSSACSPPPLPHTHTHTHTHTKTDADDHLIFNNGTKNTAPLFVWKRKWTWLVSLKAIERWTRGRGDAKLHIPQPDD